MDPASLSAAVGPRDTGLALGLNETDGLRLFEHLANTIARLMEKCLTEPSAVGHGAELPPVLIRHLDRLEPSNPAAVRKLRLHVMRGTAHVLADGETIVVQQRYLPLACSRGVNTHKRKVAASAQQAAVQHVEDSSGAGPSEGAPDLETPDYLGREYDLGVLLLEVGGNDALLRELIEATANA